MTKFSSKKKQTLVDELFKAVGLRPEQQRLFPHQFSGGQRQRISIARALASQPEVIICDEPTSALDVSVQAQVLNLLKALQKDFGLTYLFITHDIATVRAIADSIAVMYQGEVARYGGKTKVLSPPFDDYTDLLLSSVPEMKLGWLEDVISNRKMNSGGH